MNPDDLNNVLPEDLVRDVINTPLEEVSENVVVELSLLQKEDPLSLYPNNPKIKEYNQTINESYTTLDILRVSSSIKEKLDILSYNLKHKKNIFIFGAGGTTSWFLPKLLKLYVSSFLKKPQLVYDLNIVLVDGDIVEPKNLIRQNFISEDIGKNKAEVLAERYSDIYENISVSYVPKFATYSLFDQRFLPENEYPEELFVNISSLLTKDSIVINLVDNEGFKKKLDFFLKRKSENTFDYFSAGVNLYNGQVYYSKIKGDTQNGYVCDHEDLLESFTEVSTHACADADAEGTQDNPDQLFNGNDIAASLLCNIYQSFLVDIPLYKKIHFVSGNNIHVSKGDFDYSLLWQYSKIAGLDNNLSSSLAYVRRYGTNKKTLVAQHHYSVLKNNPIFNFLKIFEQDDSLPV